MKLSALIFALKVSMADVFFFFFNLATLLFSVQCPQDRVKYCRGAAVMTPRCWPLVLLLLTCSMKIYNVGSQCDLSSRGLSRRTSMKVQAVCAVKHAGAQPFNGYLCGAQHSL